MTEIWYVRPLEIRQEALLALSQEHLPADERERAGAFRFDIHRHEYLVTRVLCRGVLSMVLGRPPSSIGFQRNAYGRPELDPPSEVQFNLSNTVSMVVCAVDHGRQLGVDTEPLVRADQILEVASSVFTPVERERLDRLELEARRVSVVRLWTLKEAYMKARGMGMSIPPSSFAIDLDTASNSIAVRPNDDDPTRWVLHTLEVGDHIIATCVERRGIADCDVSLHRADLHTMFGTTTTLGG